MSFRRNSGDRYSWGPPKNNKGTMREISTKTLFITGKKYFLVMMENKVEKFMKFSEVLLNGQKSKIIMDMPTTAEFYEKLVDMCHFISSDEIKNLDSRSKDLGGQGGDGGDPRSTLKSDSIFHSERRYYFDLQQNFRGIFLKITMRTPTSDRVQIIIPASGMPDVRDALESLLKEHSVSFFDPNPKKSDEKLKVVDSETYNDPFLGAAGEKADNSEMAGKKKIIYIPDSDEEISAPANQTLGENGGGNLKENQNNYKNNNKNNNNNGGGDDDGTLVCNDRKFLFEVRKGESEGDGLLKITEIGNKFRSVVNVPECLWKPFIDDVENRILLNV